MGQYWKPIILEEKVEGELEKIRLWMYSHDFDNGSKLMEHSYQGNNFVSTFERLLTRRGGHYKSRVVWCGDYADGELHSEYTDESGNIRTRNLYDLADEEKGKPPFKTAEKSTKDFHFILNHTKKQFVDKRKVPEIVGYEGTKIHPLPLLTAEGNGEGGGDFHGEDPKRLIGSWARDVISVEKEDPKLFSDTKNYEELIFDLVE